MISVEQLKAGFDLSRMAGLIDRFGQIGKDPDGGVTRLAFTDKDVEARKVFLKILEKEFSLDIRIDALGDIFARRPGRHRDWPVILTGSHLDSVRNGGRYDGPAGLFSSLEAFRVLDLFDIETDHPFELCLLTAEEPNDFGISTFGSRGMAGIIKKEDVRRLMDEQGNDFPSALKTVGGSMEKMDDAVRSPEEIAYFLELHIEQMPFLDSEKRDIGVVEGVTGIFRQTLILTGEADHGGTTPMDRRKDALCAASEIILKLEAAAKEEDGLAVATVGHISVFPNSINITPARVTLDMEVRSFYADRIRRIRQKLEDRIRETEAFRKIQIERIVTYDSAPVRFSSPVKQAIAEAADRLGLKRRNLISMAGHDAAHLSRITEAGMIFIPCKAGRSHCPEEFTETSSIVKGAQCLLQALLLLDQRKRSDLPYARH